MAACFKSGAHVALDLLVKYLTGFSRKTLEIVNGILIVLLSSAIFVSGISLFQLGTRQQSPALNIPMQWIYIVVPFSGLLLLYFSIRILCGYFAQQKKG